MSEGKKAFLAILIMIIAAPFAVKLTFLYWDLCERLLFR